jgi:antibiotic biosynthesis monooxygenase (ABM) superfamily enzyme
MAVILMLAVCPMSMAVSRWFAPTLAKMSLLAGSLITSVFMVFVMTYVLVPILTKLFQPWLQPRKSGIGY